MAQSMPHESCSSTAAWAALPTRLMSSRCACQEALACGPAALFQVKQGSLDGIANMIVSIRVHLHCN